MLIELGNQVVNLLPQDPSELQHNVGQSLVPLLWQEYGRQKTIDAVSCLSACHIRIKKEGVQTMFDVSPLPSRSSSRSRSAETSIVDSAIILDEEKRVRMRTNTRASAVPRRRRRRHQYVRDPERVKTLRPRKQQCYAISRGSGTRVVKSRSVRQ